MSHPLSIAFVWHMHQPYYRDLRSGECGMPWVRLHATKDYLDMVKRLETFPKIHQTFNLVPSLLDQLEEYLPPAQRSDTFLDLSRKPAESLTPEEQRFILQWFFLANIERMIRAYPRYHDLLAKRGLHVGEEEWPRVQKRFTTQDYLDLQVWFNLAWIDPWLRRQDERLSALETKGSRFTEEDKGYVLGQHLALTAQVIPAYRAAAARGQVELTTTPYYHPIMPLLCDLRVARAALPTLPLPSSNFRHPEDARWHLQQGLQRHQAAFGVRPEGVWPSEGSVSEEFLALASEAGVRWVATDEEILWRTLKCPRDPARLYQPHVWRRGAGPPVAMLFRDRELSDLMGFVYAQWDAGSAVSDFMKRLEAIHEQVRSSPRPALVSIILDGENAWEYYPNDGHEFLSALYHALSSDERFRCVTVSEFLHQYPLEQTEPLPEVFSGSWIYGNFATWVGHPEKNAAWEHLVQAREALAAINRDDPANAQAWKSLGVAEGSDWMWWFGDTHFSAQAEDFDRLFRAHVSNCYQFANLPIPTALSRPIRRKMVLSLFEPTGMIHPTIDGRETSYYEWLYAGRIDLKQRYTAIQRGDQCLRYLYYGFNQTHQYLRLDLDRVQLLRLTDWAIELALSHGVRLRISPVPLGPPGTTRPSGAGQAPAPFGAGQAPAPSGAGQGPESAPPNRSGDGVAVQAQVVSPPAAAGSVPCALNRILELAVPFALLGLSTNEPLELAVSLAQGGETLERYPTEGTFQLNVSAADLEAQAWSV